MIRSIWRVLVGLMRELADENAYARHLLVHGETASPDAWRRFHEHRLKAKYQNAKCC
jgi:uncharacterized short protein YbdD (DUF466 family)